MTATRSPSRPPDQRTPCPACGPDRRNAANRVRPVRAEWVNPDGSVSWFCNRCGDRGFVKSGGSVSHHRPVINRSQDHTIPRQQMAKTLWARSVPIRGTPAEIYLTSARALSRPIPPTLRYLPAYREYPHAMIGAFAIVGEAEPGELMVPQSICAVHLTELSKNGHTKIGKRMLGPVSGHPICLAPPNNGLGLILAEGIEDALSAHIATGLGAWAAGSAPHLAKLADVVPAHVECVTILQDDDEAGAHACERLSRALLRRGFEVRVVRLGRYYRAA